MCPGGYFGHNCSELCQAGSYGLKCAQKCECFPCHHIYGCLSKTGTEGNKICLLPNITVKHVHFFYLSKTICIFFLNSDLDWRLSVCLLKKKCFSVNISILHCIFTERKLNLNSYTLTTSQNLVKTSIKV